MLSDQGNSLLLTGLLILTFSSRFANIIYDIKHH